jgi:hypothetical protein
VQEVQGVQGVQGVQRVTSSVEPSCTLSVVDTPKSKAAEGAAATRSVTLLPPPAAWLGEPVDLVDQSGDRSNGHAEPILVENRPEHLVVILAVAKERTTQHAFLHGADLPERAVAAAVLD